MLQAQQVNHLAKEEEITFTKPVNETEEDNLFRFIFIRKEIKVKPNTSPPPFYAFLQ